jgi:hypothetical protein
VTPPHEESTLDEDDEDDEPETPSVADSTVTTAVEV